MILASASTVVGIVVGVLVVLLVVFFVGGLVAMSRRRTALHARLKAEIAEADKALAQARAGDRGWERAAIEAADAALAQARAQDRGWERATIEAAARAAVAPREVRELQLVQVVDMPGTDEDQAVFRVVGADGAETTLTLGRRDGAWVAL